MRSTFHGLEVARRGMVAQQSALYTTGHNISNANTPGYSRQRVNFEQTLPYPPASRNRPQIPGQMGTGVEAGSIQRIRDQFVEAQYREEHNKTGYYDARSEALVKMEEIMNEPSSTGLRASMDQFWQSLEDLASNPESSSARSAVRQRGISLANTFHYLHDSLTKVREDLSGQIDVTVGGVNSLLDRIKTINEKVGQIEPHGYVANDLYDQRDVLVAELSQLVNIKVTRDSTSQFADPAAVGTYKIELLNETGQTTLGTLVDHDGTTGTLSATATDPREIQLDGAAVTSLRGKLQGLVEAYNTIYPDMLTNLDTIAFEFAEEFNAVHQTGTTLNGTTGISFFENFGNPGAAKNISVSNAILTDLNNIAASKSGYAGDNRNAIELSNLKFKQVINGSTIDNYYGSVIGKMAVDSQSAKNLLQTSETLKAAVDNRRQSISAVSLDEEMTNMIKFQHAYNASARNITLIDEMLDRIINGMGVVGR